MEVETEDPVAWVRSFLKENVLEITLDRKQDGSLVIFAVADGLTQKFLFTPF